MKTSCSVITHHEPNTRDPICDVDHPMYMPPSEWTMLYLYSAATQENQHVQSYTMPVITAMYKSPPGNDSTVYKSPPSKTPIVCEPSTHRSAIMYEPRGNKNISNIRQIMVYTNKNGKEIVSCVAQKQTHPKHAVLSLNVAQTLPKMNDQIAPRIFQASDQW